MITVMTFLTYDDDDCDNDKFDDDDYDDDNYNDDDYDNVNQDDNKNPGFSGHGEQQPVHSG